MEYWSAAPGSHSPGFFPAATSAGRRSSPERPRSVSGLLFVNWFNAYLTTRLVEDRSDTYGALGIAAALLFSLYLVGRVIVGSAVLNATLDARRRENGNVG